MKRTLLAIALILLVAPLAAQDAERYEFIQYDSNRLRYDSTSAAMQSFFGRWKRIVETGSGNLNIVHIGGSHVQAGTLPNTVRVRLLGQNPDRVGSRGMIFPYSAAARCNNPSDYRIHCHERMSLNRCVAKEHPIPLGLCGIAVTAVDTVSEIQVILNDNGIDYATNRVVVIGHSDQEVVPTLSYDGRTVAPSYIDHQSDRFVFNLSRTVDSFAIQLPCALGQQFSLTGLYLGNSHAGITYSSIGVNGASVPDYLRCSHFVRDLRMLHPDLVVFGIGINDAVPTNFDTAAFRRNYLQLVDSVRAANPDCTFIFITNNDSFRKVKRRKYNVNTNGTLAREVFYRLARETGGAVWDQFEIMGGLRSMDRWRQARLAQTDRVHFTAAGYRLVGNLFADALLNELAKASDTTTGSTR